MNGSRHREWLLLPRTISERDHPDKVWPTKRRASRPLARRSARSVTTPNRLGRQPRESASSRGRPSRLVRPEHLDHPGPSLDVERDGMHRHVADRLIDKRMGGAGGVVPYRVLNSVDQFHNSSHGQSDFGGSVVASKRIEDLPDGMGSWLADDNHAESRVALTSARAPVCGNVPRAQPLDSMRGNRPGREV